MKAPISYEILSLGDSALVINFGNDISEEINDVVIRLMNDLAAHPVQGIIETVPAYTSLTVFYNVIKIKQPLKPGETAFFKIKDEVEKRISTIAAQPQKERESIRIPVCYHPSFGFDLQDVAAIKKMPVDTLVDLHLSKIYRVYMNGFLPGFAYMGETDERIRVKRKSRPVPVPAGSVAIAGRQTGIYPLNSPGGWQVIGRTPVRMFTPEKDPPVHLQAGDRVQFYSISYDEFENYQSWHPR